MPKKITVVPAIEVLPQWNELARTSPYATYFQTSEAYMFFSSQAFLETFALAVLENNKLTGVVSGYIQAEKGLKRFFSRRAIINGGVLIDPDISREALYILLDALKKQTPKAIYVEIRNLHSYNKVSAAFTCCGYKRQPHCNVKITCDSWNDIYKRMHKNRRRILRLNMPKGYSCEFARTTYQIHYFYQLLKDHYKKKVKKPLFPYSFFESLILSKQGKLLLLCKEDVIIGGMVQVFLPGKAVYDFYACALDDENSEVSPSVMLYGATIKYALKKGIPLFDTMGAGKPDVPYGVRDFKVRFGGDLVQDDRFLYVHKSFLYKLGVWYIQRKSKNQ